MLVLCSDDLILAEISDADKMAWKAKVDHYKVHLDNKIARLYALSAPNRNQCPTVTHGEDGDPMATLKFDITFKFDSLNQEEVLEAKRCAQAIRKILKTGDPDIDSNEDMVVQTTSFFAGSLVLLIKAPYNVLEKLYAKFMVKKEPIKVDGVAGLLSMDPVFKGNMTGSVLQTIRAQLSAEPTGASSSGGGGGGSGNSSVRFSLEWQSSGGAGENKLECISLETGISTAAAAAAATGYSATAITTTLNDKLLTAKVLSPVILLQDGREGGYSLQHNRTQGVRQRSPQSQALIGSATKRKKGESISLDVESESSSSSESDNDDDDGKGTSCAGGAPAGGGGKSFPTEQAEKGPSTAKLAQQRQAAIKEYITLQGTNPSYKPDIEGYLKDKTFEFTDGQFNADMLRLIPTIARIGAARGAKRAWILVEYKAEIEREEKERLAKEQAEKGPSAAKLAQQRQAAIKEYITLQGTTPSYKPAIEGYLKDKTFEFTDGQFNADMLRLTGSGIFSSVGDSKGDYRAWILKRYEDAGKAVQDKDREARNAAKIKEQKAKAEAQRMKGAKPGEFPWRRKTIVEYLCTEPVREIENTHSTGIF